MISIIQAGGEAWLHSEAGVPTPGEALSRNGTEENRESLMNGDEAPSPVRAQKLPRTEGPGVAGVWGPHGVRSEPADLTAVRGQPPPSQLLLI